MMNSRRVFHFRQTWKQRQDQQWFSVLFRSYATLMCLNTEFISPQLVEINVLNKCDTFAICIPMPNKYFCSYFFFVLAFISVKWGTFKWITNGLELIIQAVEGMEFYFLTKDISDLVKHVCHLFKFSLLSG